MRHGQNRQLRQTSVRHFRDAIQCVFGCSFRIVPTDGRGDTPCGYVAGFVKPVKSANDVAHLVIVTGINSSPTKNPSASKSTRCTSSIKPSPAPSLKPGPKVILTLR